MVDFMTFIHCRIFVNLYYILCIQELQRERERVGRRDKVEREREGEGERGRERYDQAY